MIKNCWPRSRIFNGEREITGCAVGGRLCSVLSTAGCEVFRFTYYLISGQKQVLKMEMRSGYVSWGLWSPLSLKSVKMTKSTIDIWEIHQRIYPIWELRIWEAYMRVIITWRFYWENSDHIFFQTSIPRPPFIFTFSSHRPDRAMAGLVRTPAVGLSSIFRRPVKFRLPDRNVSRVVDSIGETSFGGVTRDRVA